MARADAFPTEMNSPAALAGSLGMSMGNAPELFFELGIKYAVGRDVPADLVTAHKWFNLAALKGNHAAREYRSEIARDMTKTQIATAQRLAREFLSGRC